MTDGGIKNLIAAASRHAGDTAQACVEDGLGDSPIEKLFFGALQAHVFLGASEYSRLFVADDEDVERRALANERNIGESPTLIIRSQAQLDGWRVDFLIHAYDFARKGGPMGWRKLIVECDGHDFHERTKQQAAKDRSRDRNVQLNDYSVLRFTGSELYKDAWGCAEQVTFWAVKGFP